MITDRDIHGHEVLRLVEESNPRLTRATLVAEATRRWGPDARFHTCSKDGMTLEELLDFLMRGRKIVDTDGALSLDTGRLCSDY